MQNEPITQSNYKQYVFEKMPKSAHWKNMFWAFVVGGTICTIGQGFIELYKLWFSQQDASVLASATLVALSPALEFRSEGYVYGVGAKMFQVAGPVIVNGVTISVIVALITLIMNTI